MMRKLMTLAVCVLLLPGCSFIMQDGESIKYYGIREDDGAVLSHQIARLQGQEPRMQTQSEQVEPVIDEPPEAPVKIK